MKVKIEMDLEPEEARKLMGLPEVETMQADLMDQIKERMQQEITNMTDVQAFMEKYLPVGMNGVEQFQKMMGEFMNMNKNK